MSGNSAIRARLSGTVSIEDARQVVEAIRECRSDGERAHGIEDDLYEAVLYTIARGDCDVAAELAQVALETKRIKFERWTA